MLIVDIPNSFQLQWMSKSMHNMSRLLVYITNSIFELLLVNLIILAIRDLIFINLSMNELAKIIFHEIYLDILKSTV